jgi:hypothetical protein
VESALRSPARKRTTANPAARSLVGSVRDVEVLASLVWAGFLTTRQIERLHFPSRRRAQRRLRALLDHGLVRAHLQAGALERENVYVATLRGVDLVEESGLFRDVPPTPVRVPRISKLAHGLAIRDVFVEALLWERRGASRAVDVLFEGELARDAMLRAAGLIPDVLVMVEVAGARDRFFVEVDLGTETTTTLREKFGKWSIYLAGSSKDVRLVLLASRPGRVATLDRLAGECGLGVHALAAELGAVGSLLDHAPRPLAAPPDQTERRGVSQNPPASAPVPAAKSTAFRPRRS